MVKRGDLLGRAQVSAQETLGARVRRACSDGTEMHRFRRDDPFAKVDEDPTLIANTTRLESQRQ